MMYPTQISVDNQVFPIDTDYRTALRCFEVLMDESIENEERSFAIIYILLGDLPDANWDKIIKLLVRYLKCDREQTESNIPDMDMKQDAKYIIASFLSDYQIDLSKDTHVHWWHFIDLLDGLSGECILNRIRDIRTCDINDYKGKYRSKMQKAKEQVALKQTISDEDLRAIEEFDALLNGNNELSKDDYILEEEGDDE